MGKVATEETLQSILQVVQDIAADLMGGENDG